MSKIAVRVTDVRKPPGNNFADAYFTAKIGEEDDAGTFFPLISIRDCELRTSQAGEQYAKYPSKPRIKKIDQDTAAYTKDDAGKVIYDPVVDAAMEKGTNDRWFATDGAKKLKDQLARLAAKELGSDKAETAGRGSGAATPAKAPPKGRAPAPRAAAAASTGAAERGSPTQTAEDDDLPFG